MASTRAKSPSRRLWLVASPHVTGFSLGAAVVAVGAVPFGFGLNEANSAHPAISPWHTGWVISGAVVWCVAVLLILATAADLIWTWWGQRGDGGKQEVIAPQPGPPPQPNLAGNVTTYGPTLFALGPGAHADHGSYTNVTVGAAPPLPPKAPPQVPTTEEERDSLRNELGAVGKQIQTFIPGWYVDPAEASRRASGEEVTHQNFGLAMEWRNQHDADYSARYVKEMQPRVIDVYYRARIRGFFDARVEDLISSTDLGGVRLLTSLLVALSARDLER
jgi:hypothetical protein